MRKMTNLSIFWSIVMVGLFGALLLYSVYYTKNEDYINLEKEMVKIVKDEAIFSKQVEGNDFTIIESSQLDKYIEFNVDHDKCFGTVEVRKTIFGNWYRAFIECGDYETIRIF